MAFYIKRSDVKTVLYCVLCSRKLWQSFLCSKADKMAGSEIGSFRDKVRKLVAES